ncbi:hypothetical protein DSCO28_34580 [Desulfosarcina ovata subsp. sediminis]|uniref:Uncharacterized protein n=1 Tax=Desulfosarcina ovata subsp. sediminis TaxID=885957 RepID=A0A5K7ZL40_9BACT|nr:hypothetical protein DSCO28_34580 [Desulfosarcina ovata subsp. sediminis]
MDLVVPGACVGTAQLHQQGAAVGKGQTGQILKARRVTRADQAIVFHRAGNGTGARKGLSVGNGDGNGQGVVLGQVQPAIAEQLFIGVAVLQLPGHQNQPGVALLDLEIEITGRRIAHRHRGELSFHLAIGHDIEHIPGLGHEPLLQGNFEGAVQAGQALHAQLIIRKARLVTADVDPERAGRGLGIGGNGVQPGRLSRAHGGGIQDTDIDGIGIIALKRLVNAHDLSNGPLAGIDKIHIQSKHPICLKSRFLLRALQGQLGLNLTGKLVKSFAGIIKHQRSVSHILKQHCLGTPQHRITGKENALFQRLDLITTELFCTLSTSLGLGTKP